MSDLVSIIIPCFNAEKWIEESIESCLNQTYQNLEIIVVDDGSTDASAKIVEGFSDRITLIKQKNTGSNAARNRGFSLASGACVLFLDADDYILPKRVEKQMAHLLETKADVVFSSVRSQKHLPNGSTVMGSTTDERYHVAGEDVLENLITSRRLAHTLSPIVTYDAVEQVGGWDESVKCSQDRDFILSLALAGARFEFLPGCYSVYRQYASARRVSVQKGRVRAQMSLRRTYKAEKILAGQPEKYKRYQPALAQAFFRSAFLYANRYSDKEYQHILEKIESLQPEYCADFSFISHPNRLFQTFEKILGFKSACLLYRWIKRQANTLKTIQTLPAKASAPS